MILSYSRSCVLRVAREVSSVRKGQHGAEAERTIGSMSSLQLLISSQHASADGGIVHATDPELIISS